MKCFSTWTGAAHINYKIRETGFLKRSWRLRWKPVCGSTEIELSRWLKSRPLATNTPRAFLAARQSFGKGQRGRVWDSPIGGVWLSAAIPLDSSKKSPGLFGLAVAIALANRLEESLIPVKLKWPNDLLVYRKKIAGFLPRVIYRGQIPTCICLGIGLNVSNRVPDQGISLSDVFGKTTLSTSEWTLEVLKAIEKATFLVTKPDLLCSQGERLLWAKKLTKSDSSEMWNIEGLDLNGQLKVRRGFRRENWNRWQ